MNLNENPETQIAETTAHEPVSMQSNANILRRHIKEDPMKEKLAKHRLWMNSMPHEYPMPYTPYKIGVYIRYYNQTRYENYLEKHLQQFMDDIALCPQWTLVDFYEFNGSHPWEIIPSGSTEYSLHLYVFHSEAGYYFSLSGSTFHRSKDTICSFLALHDAGFPIKLYEGARMLTRLEETDWIGIVPQGRPTDYVHQIMQHDVLDAVHLSDGDKPELVAAKAVWQPEAECRLL